MARSEHSYKLYCSIPDPRSLQDPRSLRAESGRDRALRTSLTSLSQLRVGHGQPALEEMLTRITHLALQAIPGADGVGLTVLQDGLADTMVGSAEFVRQVDADQYRLGEGPCITATAEGRTVRVGSISDEPAFPRFGPLAARLGVHSALSLPLHGSDGILGSLNVYAHVRYSFDIHAAEVGELFANPAAIAVQNAQTLAQAGRLVSQLQIACTHRSAIDQALGIVMGRSGCSASQALETLQRMSRAENRDLSAVVTQVIDGAVLKSRMAQTND